MKKTTLFVAAFFLVSGSGIAADLKVSKEDRQKMADKHAKMAECLKSDKPMGECKAEMGHTCGCGKENGTCPMHGGKKGHMKGHDHGHMHGDDAEAPAAKE